MKNDEPLGSIGGTVSVALRTTFDETVESQPPQIVRHLAGGVGVRISARELRDGAAQLAMPKAGGAQGKQTEGLHQREHPAIAEPETSGALVVHDDRVADGAKVVFTDQAGFQLLPAPGAPLFF